MRSSTLLYRLLIVTLALTTSSCETTDRALTAAERVVRSRTGQTVIDLAEGKDPAQIAKKRLDQYARDPDALLRDLHAAKKDFEIILAALGVNIGKTWGKKEVQLPERKKYVKYTQNYKSRAIVNHVGYTVADFDRDKARAELVSMGVKNVRDGGLYSLHMLDPFGYDVQISGFANNALTDG